MPVCAAVCDFFTDGSRRLHQHADGNSTIKHYKSIEYMKRTILSINMIGNEKQKTWQKNTIFKSKMLKVL